LGHRLSFGLSLWDQPRTNPKSEVTRCSADTQWTDTQSERLTSASVRFSTALPHHVTLLVFRRLVRIGNLQWRYEILQNIGKKQARKLCWKF